MARRRMRARVARRGDETDEKRPRMASGAPRAAANPLAATMAAAGNQAVQRLLASGAGPVIQRAGAVFPEQLAGGERARAYINSAGDQGSKEFSALERMWIDDVLNIPAVQLVLQSYPQAEPVVLHRVESLGTAVGEYSNTSNSLALADNIYDQEDPEFGIGSEETDFPEEYEHKFKSTLIHELFHYLENAVEKGGRVKAPKDIVLALSRPKLAGFDMFSFGWFVHPKTGRVAYLGDNLMDPADPESIEHYPEIRKAKSDGAWEPSPYTGGRETSSAEEDAAESFAMAIVTPESSMEFKSRYPKRYELFEKWLVQLVAEREKQEAAAGE